mmetsp:Transcript_18825/g.29987  ORF Transcript_18825/g.29987 Transcript_18825/m.29987 type:complete len:214 (-) Transcript_18825:1068-1709(-)
MWTRGQRSRTLSRGYVDSAHALSHVDMWTALTNCLIWMWNANDCSRTLSCGYPCGYVDTAYELSHLDVDSKRLLMNSLPWICGYLDSAHELYHVMRCSVLQCVAVCCSALQRDGFFYFFFLLPVFILRIDPFVICGFTPKGLGLFAALLLPSLRRRTALGKFFSLRLARFSRSLRISDLVLISSFTLRPFVSTAPGVPAVWRYLRPRGSGRAW